MVLLASRSNGLSSWVKDWLQERGARQVREILSCSPEAVPSAADAPQRSARWGGTAQSSPNWKPACDHRNTDSIVKHNSRVQASLRHFMSLETMTTSMLFFFQCLYEMDCKLTVANWKSWSCIFQTASTHRNYPITCLPRIIYVMGQSSISHAFPKSQGRKKNAFADKRMHLLYVDSVKGSKDSKAKCLLSMVLQK